MDANGSDLDNLDAKTNDIAEADQGVDVDNVGVDQDVDSVEANQDDGGSPVDDPSRIMTPRKIAAMVRYPMPVSVMLLQLAHLPYADEATPGHSQATTNSHNAQDVLQDHHTKNHCPHMPDLDELKTLHQHTTTQDSAGFSSEEEVVVPCKRMRTVKATAQNIHFYPPSWKDILETAKKKSRLGLLTSMMSKCNDFLQMKGIEYLLETLEDFGSQDMAVLLWDDHTTMHSKMKKIVCPIVLAHYKILPPNVDDKNDYEQEDGTFLWDGVDAQGRTNNLANKALGSFCMSYFYKGKNVLMKTFPDLFADAVPKGAVALSATALAAAIDEYKTSTYKQMKFMAKLYQPIYDNVHQEINPKLIWPDIIALDIIIMVSHIYELRYDYARNVTLMYLGYQKISTNLLFLDLVDKLKSKIH
ncbi:hypothetical protein DFH29DRAFT_874811 [Suillus ampliporus]|nr:hypothetical protein DFH29DRAFT_874811 [Suillus ampliporus]